MNVRRATAEDAPALARVHVESWRAAYRGLIPDSFLLEFIPRRREESFRQSLDEGSEETHLVEVGHEVVGFFTVGGARDLDLEAKCTGEIWGIYVSPGYWRRGIGRKLAGEALRSLKSRGYENAVLWVLEGNERARKFYEAIGFRLDGEFKNIEWGKPVRALRYRKALGPSEQDPC